MTIVDASENRKSCVRKIDKFPKNIFVSVGPHIRTGRRLTFGGRNDTNPIITRSRTCSLMCQALKGKSCGVFIGLKVDNR